MFRSKLWRAKEGDPWSGWGDRGERRGGWRQGGAGRGEDRQGRAYERGGRLIGPLNFRRPTARTPRSFPPALVGRARPRPTVGARSRSILARGRRGSPLPGPRPFPRRHVPARGATAHKTRGALPRRGTGRPRDARLGARLGSPPAQGVRDGPAHGSRAADVPRGDSTRKKAPPARPSSTGATGSAPPPHPPLAGEGPRGPARPGPARLPTAWPATEDNVGGHSLKRNLSTQIKEENRPEVAFPRPTQ